MRFFGVSEHRLNALERDGKILGLRWENRVIYNRARLEELLNGPSRPTPGPRLKRLGKISGVSGEQLSWVEIGNAAAAA